MSLRVIQGGVGDKDKDKDKNKQEEKERGQYSYEENITEGEKIEKEILAEHAASESRRNDAITRHLPSWIASYLKYTAEQEAPEVFHTWAAIGTVAGALQNRVYIERGYMRVYPNMYTIAVAESATSRKSTSIDLAALHFLDKIPFANVITGIFTGAGIWDMMDKEYKKGDLILSPQGCVFLHASELTHSIHDDSERRRILEMLTDLYGGKKAHDITRKGGRKEITQTCINLMAATTPKGITEVITNSLVGMGLIGRVIWIYEEGVRHHRSILDFEDKPGDKKLAADLIHDLVVISQLKGVIEFTPEAASYYSDWYNKFSLENHARTQYEKEYFARKGTHVLKLSIILSVDESSSLLISKKHVERAFALLERVEKNAWKTFKLVGTDTNVLAVDIITYLAGKPAFAATTSQIITTFKHRIKRKSDLDAATDILSEEGLVVTRYLPTHKKTVFILTDMGMKVAGVKRKKEEEESGKKKENGEKEKM